MILLMSNVLLEPEFIAHVRSLGVWNEVIEIKEKAQKPADVKMQITNVFETYGVVDVVHVFSFGHLSCHLINNLSKDRAKVILTEGSNESKMPLALYKYWRNYDNGQLPEGFEEFQFENVQEVLLFEPRTFDGSLNVPVNGIDIKGIFNYNDIEIINQIFDYQYNQDHCDVFICESYLSLSGMITERCERYLRNRVLEICKDKKCLLKLHPNGNWQEQYQIVNQLDIKVMTDNIPAELFLLNRILFCKDDLYIIVQNSSFAVNAMIISEKLNIDSVKIIDRVGIDKQFYSFKNSLKWNIGSLQRYNELYERKIFIPGDWESLSVYINGRPIRESQDNEFIKYDYSILINEYHALNKQKNNVNKYKLYYEAENFLLRILNRGFCLNEFFDNRKYAAVALYGTGDFAERLSEILGDRVLCYVNTDEPAFGVFAGKKVLSLGQLKDSEYYSRIQAIIITPLYAEGDIVTLIEENGIKKDLVRFSDITNFFD